MYVSYDASAGFPPRLYRTVDEIKRDIGALGERIGEISFMLNVRNIVTEVISENSGDDISRKAEAVSELIEEAEAAFYELTELRSSLSLLKDELYEALTFGGGV